MLPEIIREEEEAYIIGYCICNCPILRIGERVVYTCQEYPCYPQEIGGRFAKEDEDDN